MGIVLTISQYVLIYCLICWAMGFAWERLSSVPAGQSHDYKFARLAPIYPVGAIFIVVYIILATVGLTAGYFFYESFICRDHRSF